MDKQNMVHKYSGILFSLKRKEILTHATTWTNLEDMLSETVTKGQVLYDSSCMRYLE